MSRIHPNCHPSTQQNPSIGSSSAVDFGLPGSQPRLHPYRDAPRETGPRLVTRQQMLSATLGDSESFADDKTTAVINSSSHSRLLPGLSPGKNGPEPAPSLWSISPGTGTHGGMGYPWQEGERGTCHPTGPLPPAKGTPRALARHPLTDIPGYNSPSPSPPSSSIPPSSPPSHSSSIPPFPPASPSPGTHLAAAPRPRRPVPALRTRGRPAGKGREGAGCASAPPAKEGPGRAALPPLPGLEESLYPFLLPFPAATPAPVPASPAAGARGRGGAGGALGALRGRGRRRVQIGPRLLGRGSGAAPGRGDRRPLCGTARERPPARRAAARVCRDVPRPRGTDVSPLLASPQLPAVMSPPGWHHLNFPLSCTSGQYNPRSPMSWSLGWHHLGSQHPAPQGTSSYLPTVLYSRVAPSQLSTVLSPRAGPPWCPLSHTSEWHHPALQRPSPPNDIITVPGIAHSKVASPQLPTVPSPRVTSPEFPLFCTPEWHHPGSPPSCPPDGITPTAHYPAHLGGITPAPQRPVPQGSKTLVVIIPKAKWTPL